jgi:hypothetical protein
LCSRDWPQASSGWHSHSQAASAGASRPAAAGRTSCEVSPG